MTEMINLLDKNNSYIIITSFNKDYPKEENDKSLFYLEDSIYLLDYEIEKVGGYYNGSPEKSIVAYNNNKTSDQLRRDCLWLLEKYNQDCAIIKYKSDGYSKKIFRDGREKMLKNIDFDPDSNSMSYFYNGLSFSFTETKNYSFLNSKDQLSVGMVVEYFNGFEWKEKLVEDIDTEWSNSYGLLSKYQKIRFSS